MDSLTNEELIIVRKAIEFGNKCSVEQLLYMRDKSLKQKAENDFIETLKAFWNVAISIAQQKNTAKSGNSKAVLSENA